MCLLVQYSNCKSGNAGMRSVSFPSNKPTDLCVAGTNSNTLESPSRARNKFSNALKADKLFRQLSFEANDKKAKADAVCCVHFVCFVPCKLCETSQVTGNKKIIGRTCDTESRVDFQGDSGPERVRAFKKAISCSSSADLLSLTYVGAH